MNDIAVEITSGIVASSMIAGINNLDRWLSEQGPFFLEVAGNEIRGLVAL